MWKVIEQKFQVAKKAYSLQCFSNNVFQKNCLFQNKKIPTTEKCLMQYIKLTHHIPSAHDWLR